MGRRIADALGWPFRDLDTVLEERLEADAEAGGDPNVRTIKQLVAAKGWEHFREREADTLRDAIAGGFSDNDGPTVFACGGGVVETASNVELLANAATTARPVHVVMLDRHIDDIVAYLSSESERPRYDAEIAEVYARRLPLYHQCVASGRGHIITVKKGDVDWPRVTADAIQQVWNEYRENVNDLSTASSSGQSTGDPLHY
jgi:pentafunctional AROM polypeptide